MFLDDIPQQELNDANNFLKDNALYIALIFFFILVIAVVLVLFISIRNNKKEKLEKGEIIKKESLIELLGNKENIISATSRGSRVIVELKDYSLVNEDKLKNAGVISFIKMSNKITLVVEKDAEKVASILLK